MKKGNFKKKVLTTIEKLRIKGEKVYVKSISDELELSESFVRGVLSELVSENLISSKRGEYSLTDEGRGLIKVGVMGGVFDIIHIGHVKALTEAKENCDLLVVIVARDETVFRKKGKKPINDEEKRKIIVESIKPVDVSVLGDLRDFRKPLNIVSPDLIFLGHDQSLPEEIGTIPSGIQVKRLRVFVKGVSTSNLLNKLRKNVKHSPKEKL